ncbi:MAG: hypothetical protein IPL21_04765 [Saprospirales bacterium]|nr:hypothetical protein [Saprospirales bacterium]
MNQQPIIILGMHRSGTTMITKMLENLGLFVGAEKEINHESLFSGKLIIGFLIYIQQQQKNRTICVTEIHFVIK